MISTLVVISAAVLAYGVFSRRLSRTPFSGPFLFALLGVLVGPEFLDAIASEVRTGLFDALLELTLAVVLFTDASAVNSSRWREDAALPGRLLGIGLPLTIAAGWATAFLLFTELDVWQAALLGTMLAPTDAALGQAVVANPRVPQRIRTALTVESGLNDGIALPLFVVFLEIARAIETDVRLSTFLSEMLQQVLVALTVGAAVGIAGAAVLTAAQRRHLAEPVWLQVGFAATGLLAFAAADWGGGSGFIAAFVAGILAGRVRRGNEESVSEFAEASGAVLTLASFFAFGVGFGAVVDDMTWHTLVYALLSLTVVRMLPVAISLARSGYKAPTVLYLGWFGPRGLASVILTILVVEAEEVTGATTIATTAYLTVALSIVLHGFTAWWGSNRYADWAEAAAGSTDLREVRPAPDVRAARRLRID